MYSCKKLAKETFLFDKVEGKGYLEKQKNKIKYENC
jgi:hypothetical protein